MTRTVFQHNLTTNIFSALCQVPYTIDLMLLGSVGSFQVLVRSAAGMGKKL